MASIQWTATKKKKDKRTRNRMRVETINKCLYINIEHMQAKWTFPYDSMYVYMNLLSFFASVSDSFCLSCPRFLGHLSIWMEIYCIIKISDRKKYLYLYFVYIHIYRNVCWAACIAIICTPADMSVFVFVWAKMCMWMVWSLYWNLCTDMFFFSFSAHKIARPKWREKNGCK